jgi:hypothetical protein
MNIITNVKSLKTKKEYSESNGPPSLKHFVNDRLILIEKQIFKESQTKNDIYLIQQKASVSSSF